MPNNEVDFNIIENKIIELVIGLELDGRVFKFRPGQLEAVTSIVCNVMNNVKHTLLEAPTGSGKSMIGILAAYALYKLFNKKSYILVSDLSLYKQYEDDLIRFDADAFGQIRTEQMFGCIKGKENYTCWKNSCSASQAACSLQGMSVNGTMRNNYEFSCAHNCKYMQDYIKAIHAPITLMTYQLYFIQRNYVEDALFNGINKNFPARDLVICDECHKLCDICQAHFAPTISTSRPDWMNAIDKYLHNDSHEHVRAAIIRKMTMSDGDELMQAISEYAGYVRQYVMDNETIRKRLAHRTALSKIERLALASGNRARQEHCKLDDMLSFIGELKSSDYLVKTINESNISLNFIFDDIMLKKYFHSKSKCEMLMSATIGNFGRYASLNGLDKSSCKAISLPSTFDFSKSPIMFSSHNKMSYAEKNTSIANIAEQASEICKENDVVRGIIQTGSYANTKALLEHLPKDVLDRCLIYNGAVEKRQMLDEFVERAKDPKDNSILVGPTLIEGLNFPDDVCRFQICIKVPYACLGSEYVKKKMQYVPGWYEYDVLNKLCQGIGRGVRHEHDWCKTYILDGCISYLVSKLEKFSTLNGRFKKF